MAKILTVLAFVLIGTALLALMLALMLAPGGATIVHH